MGFISAFAKKRSHIDGWSDVGGRPIFLWVLTTGVLREYMMTMHLHRDNMDGSGADANRSEPVEAE